MNNTLALFDFDGTLYRGDSLISLAIFRHGRRKFLSGMFWLMPSLVMMKLGLKTNQQAKEAFLKKFFGEMDETGFKMMCGDFARTVIPEKLHHQTYHRLKNHLQAGHTVKIVTASAPEWIAPWSESLGVEVIGTHLEYRHGKITGKISGLNCNHGEKVHRIRQCIDPQSFSEICVYGNGRGDAQMMKLRTRG